jgi:uncharacterized protein (DUF433 family)
MRKTQPISLRLRPDLLSEVKRLAARLRRPKSQVLESLIDEAIRVHRCPGIVFADGPTGRRAVVAGTGIDVWEVVRVHRSCGENLDALVEALPHLSRRQLEAALHYYRCYPREIDERLALEDEREQELLRGFPAGRVYQA